MKKDLTKLTRELFKDPELLINIGFSKRESTIFYQLIQGQSIAEIANRMDLPYYEVSYIKRQRFHLIPVFLQRKLDQLSSVDFEGIQRSLLALNQQIVNSIHLFKNSQVYSISELRLSKRTINSLIAYNIKTTEDLLSYNLKELAGVKNIGQKALKEIELELKRLKLLSSHSSKQND
ncbi:MAG: DNA-directed RNA polymerase subunit alpha C-terminal domain-containing protein [Bacteroidota bacterium]